MVQCATVQGAHYQDTENHWSLFQHLLTYICRRGVISGPNEVETRVHLHRAADTEFQK
jgi:hypothetical protein